MAVASAFYLGLRRRRRRRYAASVSLSLREASNPLSSQSFSHSVIQSFSPLSPQCRPRVGLSLSLSLVFLSIYQIPGRTDGLIKEGRAFFRRTMYEAGGLPACPVLLAVLLLSPRARGGMQIERGGRSVLRSGGKLSSLMPLIQLAGPAPPNARTHPSFFTEVKPGRSCSYPHPHSRADGSSGVDVKQTTRSSSVITAPLARVVTQVGAHKLFENLE